MNIHPAVIIANIENATHGAITRRKPRRQWPMGVVAAVSVVIMIAAIVAGQ